MVWVIICPSGTKLTCRWCVQRIMHTLVRGHNLKSLKIIFLPARALSLSLSLSFSLWVSLSLSLSLSHTHTHTNTHAHFLSLTHSLFLFSLSLSLSLSLPLSPPLSLSLSFSLSVSWPHSIAHPRQTILPLITPGLTTTPIRTHT